jgi:hypothetical protein
MPTPKKNSVSLSNVNRTFCEEFGEFDSLDDAVNHILNTARLGQMMQKSAFSVPKVPESAPTLPELTPTSPEPPPKNAAVEEDGAIGEWMDFDDV